MNVVAQFSKLKALTYVGFNFIVTLALIAIFLDAPKGVSLFAYWLSDERLHRPLVLLGPIVVPILCVLQISILRQLLFNGSRAVWISAGRLWFLNFYGKPFFSSLLVSDVDHLSLNLPKRLDRMPLLCTCGTVGKFMCRPRSFVKREKLSCLDWSHQKAEDRPAGFTEKPKKRARQRRRLSTRPGLRWA